ncbi:hypothetical protein FNJ62_11075 [Streptomyces benahoarensis]|uniref:Uncharacterized protein n=1 Tax=Streptomyces benahoarensis TaxID=2595054 RepID=A0A553ZL68_9ACTN|nr:hypothetical protein FNJ62_11075 [Streptomyces benahoarensis]TSB42170.1 hypothetical protein FNZ23_11330 [Streptomyces benahoarensis]
MTPEERVRARLRKAVPAPYPTDGTDFERALKYHYTTATKSFLKFFPVFFLLWVQLLVFQNTYLIPLALIGLFGGLIVLLAFRERMALTRKCARVLRTYPLEFRTPVEKDGQYASHTLYLRLGGRHEDAPTLCAKDPLGRSGWPELEAGVWFAGDEPFGGAALVPGTGELLFLQPKRWADSDKERKSAGAVRTEQASRAGVTRPSRYR